MSSPGIGAQVAKYGGMAAMLAGAGIVAGSMFFGGHSWLLFMGGALAIGGAGAWIVGARMVKNAANKQFEEIAKQQKQTKSNLSNARQVVQKGGDRPVVAQADAKPNDSSEKKAA